ncbi:class I SAM-dependent methyltransferase [Streptosporangium pseudovulgare]|uniref:Methyltransferase type 11 domain-containing protein n=1 Tax=Streptosporangium pseudovulgare TaxID=35765 RepID=A0ABQ2QXN8_9ACTN|nr:class I SAM-dependent methyltransferase [Streptosporangium pseudovulgare]GGQ02359.1 hypothetical protein GCM10010140_35580 [Streptosporangium pseudovulgare]
MSDQLTDRSSAEDWEAQARNWIAWAREPGFDSYWRYRSAFFELVPAPGRATLDLGCGEGRVTRELAERGHRVTGVDVSPTLVAAAHRAGGGGRYLVADAAALPFDDGEFDLVIAYNSLMDVDDLPGSVREAGRVLAPGGRLVLSITHPVTNPGVVLDGGAAAAFAPGVSYFERHRFRSVEERGGLRMEFSGWGHPLSAYTGALEEAGLLVEALREPVTVRADGSRARVPFHLWIRAVRPADPERRTPFVPRRSRSW